MTQIADCLQDSDEPTKSTSRPNLLDQKPLYPDSGFNKNSTSLTKYVARILPDFPTPSERYYDTRLVPCTDRRSYFGQVGDQCIMFHSNKVALITIAPSHPVIRDDKTVESIGFKFEGYEKIDRLSNQCEGKSKRGSQKMQKNSPLCSLTCTDGSTYVITASIGSKLIEINEAILRKPNLVKEKPLSHGFIAIVQPTNWKHMNQLRESLPRL